MKSFFLILVSLCLANVYAQSISPQVINSAGGSGSVGSTGVTVYYNIGETFFTTLNPGGNSMITQGFLQPGINGEYGLMVDTAYITHNNCSDQADGGIQLSVRMAGVSNPLEYTFSYNWTPASLCPLNNCSNLSGLAAGTYSVKIVAYFILAPGNLIPKDSVDVAYTINGSAEPCQIKVYNGVSANGDNINDHFYIHNIESFPNNKVEIYNRWGVKLADIKNYDNTANYWGGTIGTGTDIAPSGTYFYVIDLNNGTKPVKGWLELTSQK